MWLNFPKLFGILAELHRLPAHNLQLYQRVERKSDPGIYSIISQKPGYFPIALFLQAAHQSAY
jgi:hypothetical protein